MTKRNGLPENTDTPSPEEDFRRRLREGLDLDPNATDEQVLEAITDLQIMLDDMQAVIEADLPKA